MGPQGMQQLIPSFLSAQQQNQSTAPQSEFVNQMNSYMSQGPNGAIQGNPQQQQYMYA